MLWDVMLQSRSKFLQFGKTIVRILGDEDVLYVCFLWRVRKVADDHIIYKESTDHSCYVLLRFRLGLMISTNSRNLLVAASAEDSGVIERLLCTQRPGGWNGQRLQQRYEQLKGYQCATRGGDRHRRQRKLHQPRKRSARIPESTQSPRYLRTPPKHFKNECHHFQDLKCLCIFVEYCDVLDAKHVS
jgi:hypothetical protein